MAKYDVIFFDIDDTLFDFEKAEREAFRQVCEQYKIDATSLHTYIASYKAISHTLWAELEQGEMTVTELGSERFRRLFEKHQLKYEPMKFNEDYLTCLSKQTYLVDGAEEVVRSLSNKRLAVITNGFTRVQTERIAKSQLHSLFEQVIISEAVKSEKPQKEIFDYAFKVMNILEKERVLMIGDSLTSDMRGGEEYGIDTCWFNPNDYENKTSVKPTYEIHKLNEILYFDEW